MPDRRDDELTEIALIGDLTESADDFGERLLSVPPGGRCVIYFDSPGGSPYTAMALTGLIALRGLDATGIVIGECSSAALWPFAACRRRMVTPYSILLFHTMKWESEENVGLSEAAEWARHFAQLETDMDRLLSDLFAYPNEKIQEWVRVGRYVTGREMVEAGLAEMIELKTLDIFRSVEKKKGKGEGGRRK
jgi:ATP-dependent Clp protease, protease subunit